MDEFSRFALDAAVKDEKAETECRAPERYWIRWAGAPKVLRVDSSSGHMGQFMEDWCELRGIRVRLSIVPRGVRHTLAFVERHRQVRREQLAIYKKDRPSDKLKTALMWTFAVSSRMGSVKGYSPAQHVLGATPLSPGDILGEDCHLAEQSAFTAGDSEKHMLSLSRRVSASKAFVEANTSAKVRRALLARSRPLRRDCEVSEWIYYWPHEKNDDGDITILDKVHWHGPALVVALEKSITADGPDAPATIARLLGSRMAAPWCASSWSTSVWSQSTRRSAAVESNMLTMSPSPRTR